MSAGLAAVSQKHLPARRQIARPACRLAARVGPSRIQAAGKEPAGKEPAGTEPAGKEEA
jgi:hypothetical protein